MNWTLLLSVLIGPAIIFLIDWVNLGPSFSPKKNLPWYIIAVFIPAVLSFYIDKQVVQSLLLIGAGIAIVHIFKGLVKSGAGTPAAGQMVLGKSLNAKDSWWTKFWLNPWFGWFVLSALSAAIIWMHSISYSAEVHKTQTLWTIVAIVLTLGAVGFVIKSSKTSDGQGG